MPVFRSQKIVAILGLGNKPRDYDQKDVKLVTSIANIAWDIVLRKRMEEALIKSERKYRDLFEANQDAITIFRINPDNTPSCFLDMNEAAAVSTGYSRNELARMKPTDFEKVSTEKSSASDWRKLRRRDMPALRP